MSGSPAVSRRRARRRRSTRSYALQRAQRELANESSVYIAVLASGQPQGFSDWVSSTAAREQAISSFTGAADPTELAAFASSGVSTDAPALPTAFPTTPVTPAQELDSYQSQADKLDQAITAVDGTIKTASNAAASAAESDVRTYGGATVFAMLLTLGLMWFVSKAVVGPVRRLTAAAREMSQQQLPALVESLRTGGDVSTITPTVIDVQSEDEIGELAQAFNDVEQVTLEVAQQQSILLRKGMGDLFVNLARRNQSLLERQLELLDELERNEHDPSSLDSLFKLDHMATRMRRNAESLLVLSGAEQPRQWQEAIGLLDVVRSAAAEIADFPRVELVGIDERISVSGRAVSDVSHLLAELLENTTSFSSPETTVVVSGAITKSGFVLAITDQGIGMTPDRIAEANTLLRHPPVVGLALSRALGLHVVGALAKRHGIAVEIRKASPVGTVALVALPKAILEARGRNEGSTPMAPVYSPDVDDDGAPMPLGARRAGPAAAAAPASAPTAESAAAATAVTWHPADEPPVEQWAARGRRATARRVCRSRRRRDGDGARAARGAVAEPEATFVEDFVTDQPAFETPGFETPVFETPGFETPVFERVSAFSAPVADAPPNVEHDFGFGTAQTGSATDATRATHATHAADSAGAAPGALPDDLLEDAPEEEAAHFEDLPLPTRIPGHHMTHHPVVDEQDPIDEADPMRPYHVHELLTRHSQGVRRGLEHHDDEAPGRAGEDLS